MRLKPSILLTLTLWLAFALQLVADVFEYRVKHDHLFGSCEGRLIANDREIRYEAADGKHSQSWPYIDIQKVDVGATRLVLKTFKSESWKKLEKDQTFHFSVVDGQFTVEHQKFLRSKLSRPMVARLVEKKESAPASLPVRHQHRLSGCEGLLRLEGDRLTYVTDHAHDNRVWGLHEIETIGSPDTYHLRVTTLNETFNFDLKSPLDPKIYDLLWKRIYRLENTQAPELLNQRRR
jgi:hypothetical protein